MDYSTLIILGIIVLAYAFDFINGFHDAGNAIATIVATNVLTPRQAVCWAAFFNFIAFAFFNLMVANTIGKGIIEPGIITPTLIFSALIGAISWNLITWYFGLPSSSSHALIGGLAGAAIVHGGFATLQSAGFLKVAFGIFITPVLGLLAGALIGAILARYFKTGEDKQVNRWFKIFQLASSALLSLAHGGNDAQKTMGIITALLMSAAWLDGPFHVPLWVVISCHLMISLGTLCGGWRIVRTMGSGITKLNPMRGCAAETGAAAIILASTEGGIPVSTTQTVTGSIAGVGLSNTASGTHWRLIKVIFIAWILTIPAAGLVAAGIMALIRACNG
ncbi:MAG: inorganic phosphate transporter [Legionella sp.]|jgi:PiT family inorganic phosphate transporter|nr:inorganic phosphate transporter [Legionella sp.]